MAAEADQLLATGRAVIAREAAALAALPDQLDQSFTEVIRAVARAPGKVVTTGAGTSSIIAERLAHLLAVAGTPAFHLPCLDALHGGMGAVETDDVVIAFSKGGRSSELTLLVEKLVSRGCSVHAVTENSDSPFARAASAVVALRTDPAEADLGKLIATGSTLVAGAWSDALVGALMALRGHSWKEVVDVHPGGIVGEQRFLPAPVEFEAPVPDSQGRDSEGRS